MPEDILDLPKFYLSIQKGRIEIEQHVNGKFTFLLFSCEQTPSWWTKNDDFITKESCKSFSVF